MRSYACAVSGVDDGVGAILEALADLKLEQDTLVIFTADHGLCGGHHGMWGMGDHWRPLHMSQENLCVPLIFRHPGRIAAGRLLDTMTCNYDLLLSLLSYLDLSEPLSRVTGLPGRSYAPALVGIELEWREEITFHEYENTRAVQPPRWKLVLRHPDRPDELYNLADDPGEGQNLIGRSEHATTQANLADRLHGFFSRHTDPQYDLWQGGRSKAGRSLKPDAS